MRAPRWTGLVAALLVLAGGSGCPGEPPTQCFNNASSMRPEGHVYGVGKEAAFDVAPNLVTVCGDTGLPRQPDSVTVEVKDPENRPVPATATLSADGSRASVRFTSQAEGRHHVIVSFAPVGSLQQFSVFVLADRRTETAMARLPTFSPCPHVDRTAHGTWVCGNVAWRDLGEQPQQLGAPQGTTVVAGDVVWTVDGDTVRRYVDTGAGPLDPAGTAPYPPGKTTTLAPHARLANANELVVLSDTLLHRYTFTEADGIATAPTAAWWRSGQMNLFGNDGVGAVLLRAGTRLLLVVRTQQTIGSEPRTESCAYLLDSGGGYVRASSEPCQALAGEPVGYEDEAVWTRNVDALTAVPQETLRRFAVSGGGRLEESGSVALDGQLITNPPLMRPGPVLPLLATMGTVTPYVVPRWDAERDRVALELAPAGPNFESPRVGGDFIWVKSSDGSGLSVYPRTSTR